MQTTAVYLRFELAKLAGQRLHFVAKQLGVAFVQLQPPFVEILGQCVELLAPYFRSTRPTRVKNINQRNLETLLKLRGGTGRETK